MGIKLLYAFIWQESVIKVPLIFLPETLLLGSKLVPIVNGIGNMFNSYQYFEQSFQVKQKTLPYLSFVYHINTFQDGVNVYPADYRCNRNHPHAMWHAQSSVGLLDIIYLADYVNGITKR
jgi:hypothetical protein